MHNSLLEQHADLANKYFKSLESILRGCRRDKIISDFTRYSKKYSDRSIHSGPLMAELHLLSGSLVENLSSVDAEELTTIKKIMDELTNFPARKFIYCLLGSILCVLSLHFVGTFIK